MEPFSDPARPTPERVADLLARMSLREKIGQLNQRLLGWHTWRRDDAAGRHFRLTDAIDEELERTGGIGAVYGLLRADAWSGQQWQNGAGPEQSAELAALVQEKITASSRWRIPALFAEEAPHGHQALGGTLFPTNIGMAASWRPELAEEAGRHIASELRSRGTHLALVSGLDLLRDPRWGRSEECFGEDPLLASLFTRSLVRGLQSIRGIGAVLKHFAAQGAGIGGRNGSGAPIGPRELAEVHLTAARAGVDAGAIGLMAAYNDIDGVPCIGNADLLTRILRQEWGFEGLVMADMGAIDRLTRGSGSLVDAAALALRAGVDLSLADKAFTHIEEGITDGLIETDLVDRACARVLTVKIELGLLDPPEPLPSFPPPTSTTSIAAKSVVLLHNDGTLPYTGSGRIAVIGPNGDDPQALLGDYVPPPRPEPSDGSDAGADRTVLEALRNRLGADKISFTRGCGLTTPIDGGIDEAVALAERSDLVVLVLGSSGERLYTDEFADNGAAALSGQRTVATTGEGFDSSEVELPGAQRDLVTALTATGTPIVSVIISGRPLGLSSVVEHGAATLLAWYPGPDGGRAVTEVLLGDREPVGRLPASLPRSSATLPVAYNRRMENVDRYIDAPVAALYPFGHGLGYTDWRLADWTVAGTGLDDLVTTVTVRNIGQRRGRQLVQLFGRVLAPGLMPRRAVLLGFAETAADPAGTVQVDVGIQPDAVAGLGELTGATLEIWPSITGPEDPVDTRSIRLITAVDSGQEDAGTAGHEDAADHRPGDAG
jgi:beta-glucosidase